MTPAATAYSADTRHLGWFGKSEAWLDSKGKGAWIAAMVLGFIFFWPVGLALLFYMIWTGRMGNCSKSHRNHRWGRQAFQPTGNAAFDAYREETLKRLEDEQTAFESFMERLRRAKDQAEFDQFMDERAHKAGASDDDEDTDRRDA